VLSATSTTRQVSIALDADEQSEVAVGDKVSITLPNNDVTPGVISSVGTVATAGSSGSSPTITVLVNPTEPAATGDWDQAPVNVTITTGNVTNALVLPVDALLAQSGGGYAVEVVDADGIHHLVAVTLGLFDDADGLVQVSGAGLAAGQKIVVPNL
jgi:multidrug efflux pump subunit AcrA (membrane-fusion protein)